MRAVRRRAHAGLAAVMVWASHAFASTAALPHAPAAARQVGPAHADFSGLPVSIEARDVRNWVLASNNHRQLPFLIVDKKQAMLYAFHPDGILRGTAPVLLGMATGDDSAPGIGQRKLSAILPHERTTPSGRFVAALDHNLNGVEILWVDYDAAISLHRVVAGAVRERRAQRLASASALDNRISYGCINVAASFFDHVIVPTFTGTNGIVYVLPETRSARVEFGADDAGSR